MIYVTGDLHGDLSRLKAPEIRKLKKNDFLIICGDFGFVWGDSKEEQRHLQWIGKRRFTTLFIEGTHDNLHLLEQYPLEEFGGTSARRISGKLWHLPRGKVYTLDQEKVFVFGGGESDDSDIRIPVNTWWEEELPTELEVQAALEQLRAYENKVDYIITHQAPPQIEISLNCKNSSASLLTALLDYISKECDFQRWFFGCYHLDRGIPIRYQAVFKEIIGLELQK